MINSLLTKLYKNYAIIYIYIYIYITFFKIMLHKYYNIIRALCY